MPRIPVYEKQVNPASQSVARVNVSGPEENAFGGGLGRAVYGLGRSMQEVTQQEGESLLRERKEELAKNTAKTYLAYEKEMKEALYGKVDESGAVLEEGLLNRTLGKAKGVTAQYAQVSEKLRQKYLSSASNEYEARWLDKAMGQTENSYLDNISSHEVLQRREDAKMHAGAVEKQRLEEAAGIYDPAALKEYIMLSQDLATPLWEGQGLDEAVVQQSKQNLTLKSLSGALKTLVAAESYSSAQNLLDGFKEEIPASIYASLDRQIKDGGESKNKGLLFQDSLSRFKTPGGITDYRAALSYIENPDTVKNTGLKPESVKQVGDMLVAHMNQNIAVAQRNQEVAEIEVLNQANGFVLNEDPVKAIGVIMKSGLDNTRKLSLVEGIKKSQASKTDDPAVYADLMQKVVSGEIYNEIPVLEALARGEIKKTTKDGLLQTLKQKQAPSFELYQSAVKQVTKVYNKGLLGNMTPSESVALSKTLRELKATYDSALEQKKSLQDIAELFAPEKVFGVAGKNKPDLKEIGQDSINRYKSAPVGEQVKQRAPGESIDDFVTRSGFSNEK